ncbi:TetR/AcrR family transcriptional regulator [Paraburkholderia sp. BL25I1N1]|uniref:TetR/AcrR family transcriptional regulator n=1 Tax=Paraburkholderia sp. BL25I1N1 TaxID=1938804 RepID=UPI000D067235|nr:TetR/AcrR family transcriptional regulator [Paraburkholderia sp. BL25I1N1]PRY04557.1 TetR family transcriptional regulator [Paraburkholderia sp. BL25I1N1]
MTTDTKQRILSTARRMVQARGYNALSFREIAKEVGIKSAGVHHHFPTKGDLGAALARQYTEEAVALLDDLLETFENEQQTLERYASVFRSALVQDNRMCLCGIMAAEHHDLPDEVRLEVDRFTEVNVDWLCKILSFRDDARDAQLIKRQALAIFASIEGAQLVARGRGDVSVFDDTVRAYRSAGLFA